jgi:hypothetical protein
VRPEADEVEVLFVELAVDQDQIGPDMAVAVISPLSAQRVVEQATRQGCVSRESIDDVQQGGVEVLGVTATLFAAVVAFEAMAEPNRPY